MQMSLCTTRNPPIKITLTPEGGNIYKKRNVQKEKMQNIDATKMKIKIMIITDQ
jgi:hypothetical protein